MQRILLHGVPYFINGSNELFTYTQDIAPIHIGSYNSDTDTVILKSGITSLLEPALAAWRATLTAKPRKPTTASNGGADTEEKSGDDSEEDNTDI